MKLAVGMRKLLHAYRMAQRPIRPWTNDALTALLDKFERDDFQYLSAAISKLPLTFGVDKATGVPIDFHKFDFIHQVWKDRGTVCRSADGVTCFKALWKPATSSFLFNNTSIDS
jgi:hypothetical protein